MVLDLIFNFLFGWSINIHPAFAILFITVVTTLFSTLVYKFTTKQKMIKELKEETKKLNKEMRASMNNPKRMKEIEKTLWGHNMTLFKQNLIPMVVTLIPFFLLFSWLSTTFTEFVEPLFHYFGWFGTYFILTVIFTFLFRKILRVY